MAADSIHLEPLRADQYPQVAEWEFGPQPQDTDWDRYAAEMNAPKWAHFGLYEGSSFIGCLSLERISHNMAAYHVVTARHRIHPNSLAQVLLKTAGDLFNKGFTALTARIPHDNHAASRLAIRCGMREWGYTPEIRYFMLTKSRYQNGFFKT